MKGFMVLVRRVLGHSERHAHISPHVRDSRAGPSAGSDSLQPHQHGKCQSGEAAEAFNSSIQQTSTSVSLRQRKRAASARSIFAYVLRKQKLQPPEQRASSIATQSHVSRFVSVELRTSSILTNGNMTPNSETAAIDSAARVVILENTNTISKATAFIAPEVAVFINAPKTSTTSGLHPATSDSCSIADRTSLLHLRQPATRTPCDRHASVFAPASPRPPAPPTTLLAFCPGTPETMRRPVWRLADYNIGARLYKGEVSSVYKAVCSASGMPVALKVYSLSRVADNALHTLVREIRIHTELAHPHVLMLYGAFEEGKRLVLVLERGARGDLLNVHRSLPHCRMSEDQLRMLVLAPLLDALTYLHARGVCHRDIKPENLLMTSNWQLRVADFGAAINLTAERAVTRTGTMDYMAPEVERCPLKAAPEDNKDNLGLAYSTSADVWSLGVLVYEMLVGFPPFVELKGGDGSMRQAGEGARELSFPAFVSAGGQDFISSALAERPGDRPTAAQLMRHPWVKHAVREHAVRQQAASTSHNPTLSEQRPKSRGSQQPLQRQLQQAFGATQRSKASAAQAAPNAFQLWEP